MRLRLLAVLLALLSCRTSVAQKITGFVNSKGNHAVDEDGRTVHVEAGKLISAAAAFRLEEGGEFRLEVQEGR